MNILNPNNLIDLEDKEVRVYTGMIIDNINKEVPFGNFVIPKPDSEEVKGKTSFVGYDYMLKFDIPYKSQVIYPCKAKVLFQNVCSQVGLVAGNIDFINADYMILGNPFTNNETCRVVLSNLAQLAGGFAKIGRDNKPYIVSLDKTTTVETIDGNNYFTDFSKNKQWGELNSLILRISGTEGENTTLQDDISITQNGLTELVIEDNYFLINQAEREKVATALWNNLKGLKYLPFKTDYYGYPYLDSGDKIKILDSEDNEHETYVFNHSFTFNGTYGGKLDTEALTKTQTVYKNTNAAKIKFRQVERKINKIDGTIEDVIEEQSEHNQKISQVTQTVDELRSSIGDIADLTVSSENYNAKVILGNINESEPIRIVVRPILEDISYLYPRDNLYPSNDLYLKNRKIRFATDKYEIDWEIPEDLLYYDANNYDELILDYEGQSCVINKKVKYNVDGTKSLLDKATTIEYPYPKIELEAGDYTVSLLGYNAGYLFVRLMSKNIYTTQFATKAEVNSQIKQTAQDITSTVAGTYATKNELNTAKSEIKQTTDSITSTVSKKVGENEIISKINQSAEEITIEADKIDIDGKAVHFKTNTLTSYTYTTEDVNKILAYVQEDKPLTAKEIELYDLDGDSKVTLIDARRVMLLINENDGKNEGSFEIEPYNARSCVVIKNYKGETEVTMGNSGFYSQTIKSDKINADTITFEGSNNTWINNDTFLMQDYVNNSTELKAAGITTPKLTQTSLLSKKKNINEFNANAIELIKNSNICLYNLKGEEEGSKQHIGLVVGEGYNCPAEVISEDGQGVEQYSMTSLAWKAIQELIEENKKLNERLEKLEGGRYNG